MAVFAGIWQKNAPVSVDSTKELRLQVHVIEAVKTPSRPSQTASGRHRGLLVDDLVPVGLNLALWDILKSFFPGYEGDVVRIWGYGGRGGATHADMR
jgi:hypothetical protein